MEKIFPNKIHFPFQQPANINSHSEFSDGYEEPTNLPTRVIPGTSQIQTQIPSNNVTQLNHIYCAICTNISRDPLEFPCCHHWICTRCFIQYFFNTRFNLGCAHKEDNTTDHLPYLQLNCPFCKSLILFHEIREIISLPMERVDSYFTMRVKCPNECGYVGRMFEMEGHEFYRCMKRIIRCPNYRCPEPKNDAITIHHHFRNCAFQRYHCKRCGFPVLMNEKLTHDCLKDIPNLLMDFQRKESFENYEKLKIMKIRKQPKPFFSYKSENIFEEAVEEFKKFQTMDPHHFVTYFKIHFPRFANKQELNHFLMLPPSTKFEGQRDPDEFSILV